MDIKSSVIFFPCKNMKKTREYYTKILGLSVSSETSNNLILDTNYGYIGFVEYSDNRQMESNICISFNCDSTKSVDEIYEKLKDIKECAVSSKPQHHSKFPVYSFFLSDPNGYTLEFQKLD